MIVYPAIDLKDGKCVRLLKGDMNAETVYNDDPAAQARLFQEQGFPWVHLVDLNGAVEGRPVNEAAVMGILNAVSIPAQLGGGIRDLKAIERWLSVGLSRVILGTVALTNPALVIEACRNFPGKIAVGLDARGGKVAVSGWVEDSNTTAIELAQKYEGAGVAAIIYTDIDRDGTGQGLNMVETIALAQSVKIPVIASGGVGSVADLQAVKAAATHNVEGVIVGRALYDGRISPADALQVMGGKLC